MQKRIDPVEIKEPPIQKFGKKRSCLKQSCLTGCGCIVLLLIGFILLIRFAAKPRMKELKVLPSFVTSSIPLYDEKNIERITFTPGAERGKFLEGVAMIPKIVLSPLVLVLDRYWGETTSTYQESVLQLVQTPVMDHRDFIKIEWHDLGAKPSFIAAYYQKAFTQQGFTISVVRDTDTVHQFLFSSTSTEGSVLVEDTPEKEGTDYVLMTAHVVPPRE